MRNWLIEFNEPDIIDLLGSFKCERNEDIESYLKQKAILHERHNISRTYLILDESDNIVAYFTIAIKPMKIDDVSIKNRKEVAGYLQQSVANISGYLLGQFGKNDMFASEITGETLWNYAYNIILRCHINIGLRFVFLECGNYEKLICSYENIGFKPFRHNNETGHTLMIKMISADDSRALEIA
ncbi:MAG: hypothetical protein LBC96_05930 [Lachnospiraceae bacterium]|nr:hypothetical protein [Lachnospiraceae bacterium]